MKKILSSSAFAVLLFACGDSANKTEINSTNENNKTEQTSPNESAASLEEAMASYLQVKNALADNNATAAAKAAGDLNEKLQSYGGSPLTDAQKKVYGDVKEEILEHSEHISKNADKIDHQRSHFDQLSVVMYELVKSNKVNKVLYKQYCPMYNDKKGGVWLSETKEIKNPFYGKEMLDCGEVKEEIK